MNTPIIFNGAIPRNYQNYLTPFLFDPFSVDLVQRLQLKEGENILELACGTGSVTKKLLAGLPQTAHLTATDLEPGMLAVAKEEISSERVIWQAVDMTNIPYDDDHFDKIICQFGLMLVPDKPKALREMNRVLKPGGKIFFSVWGNISDNEVWKIGGEVVESFIGINPILQNPGPFSMKEVDTLMMLNEAGFKTSHAATVNKTGAIESAASAAKGFIAGLPVYLFISKTNPALLPDIEDKLQSDLRSRLGDMPMKSRLQALVFQATK